MITLPVPPEDDGAAATTQEEAMGFFSKLSFGLWGPSVGQQPLLLKATPGSHPEFSAEQVRPRIWTTKSFPLSATESRRPTEDDFPRPKRTRSLPSTVGLAQRWNVYHKLSRVLLPTTDKQHIVLRDYQGKMAAARIRKRMLDDFKNMSAHDWFSLSYSKEMLKKEDVEAVLKQARPDLSTIPDLIAFVRDYAPQLFTMLILHRREEILDQFCHHGIDDSMFPVNFVPSEDSIESTNKGKPKKLKLDDILFASDVCDWQWKFFVPRLCWAPFDLPALDTRCKLPFLEPLDQNRIHGTDFSVVFKGIVHCDYLTVELDGIVSSHTFLGA